MMRILTLCVGNICRSPIAEALLMREFPQLSVRSAGLSAMIGMPADPLATEVAAVHGLDISAHRAQQINATLCQQSDLILVMEQGHKDWLEQLYPQVRGKVFRLGQAGQFEVTDPYRQSMPAFQTAYEAIFRGVTDWSHRIRKLSRNPI
jgi:protein-tyrosine phosphatase